MTGSVRRTLKKQRRLCSPCSRGRRRSDDWRDIGAARADFLVTLSGVRLQQVACDTAASLEDVSRGRPFTPHLEVWKVRGKVFVTDDDPDLQIITVKVPSDAGK
jgi:hypothetical protein